MAIKPNNDRLDGMAVAELHFTACRHYRRKDPFLTYEKTAIFESVDLPTPIYRPVIHCQRCAEDVRNGRQKLGDTENVTDPIRGLTPEFSTTMPRYWEGFHKIYIPNTRVIATIPDDPNETHRFLMGLGVPAEISRIAGWENTTSMGAGMGATAVNGAKFYTNIAAKGLFLRFLPDGLSATYGVALEGKQALQYRKDGNVAGCVSSMLMAQAIVGLAVLGIVLKVKIVGTIAIGFVTMGLSEIRDKIVERITAIDNIKPDRT